jgi:hypothetical protein
VDCFLSEGKFAIEAVGPWTRSTHNIATGTWTGVSELTAFATQVTGGKRIRHWSHNRVLTPVQYGIDAMSYLTLFYLDEPPTQQIVTGIMLDHLCRDGAGGPWRFASRRVTFDR